MPNRNLDITHEHLNNMRKAAGMTIEFLSGLTGIARSSLGFKLAGTRPFTEAEILAVKNILQAPKSIYAFIAEICLSKGLDYSKQDFVIEVRNNKEIKNIYSFTECCPAWRGLLGTLPQAKLTEGYTVCNFTFPAGSTRLDVTLHSGPVQAGNPRITVTYDEFVNSIRN